MDSIQVLTWAIGLGFVGTWTMMGFAFSLLNKKIEGSVKSLADRMDKFDEKLTDIDRRLCRIEGAMMNKECCILHHANKEKAE